MAVAGDRGWIVPESWVRQGGVRVDQLSLPLENSKPTSHFTFLLTLNNSVVLLHSRVTIHHRGACEFSYQCFEQHFQNFRHAGRHPVRTWIDRRWDMAKRPEDHELPSEAGPKATNSTQFYPVYSHRAAMSWPSRPQQQHVASPPSESSLRVLNATMIMVVTAMITRKRMRSIVQDFWAMPRVYITPPFISFPFPSLSPTPSHPPATKLATYHSASAYNHFFTHLVNCGPPPPLPLLPYVPNSHTKQCLSPLTTLWT